MLHKKQCVLLCSVFMFDYEESKHIYNQTEQEYELFHNQKIGFYR